jgi:hypothetical protein
MPWLPLAILLVAALTIAALALILFPPGEGGPPVAEGDITVDVDAEATDNDLADDADDEATGANVAPPPPGDDRHPQAGTRLREEGEEAIAVSRESAAQQRPSASGIVST